MTAPAAAARIIRQGFGKTRANGSHETWWSRLASNNFYAIAQVVRLECVGSSWIGTPGSRTTRSLMSVAVAFARTTTGARSQLLARSTTCPAHQGLTDSNPGWGATFTNK